MPYARRLVRVARLAAACATLALPCLMAAGAAGEATAPRSDARRIVDGFHATLLDVMQRAETLGFAGRRTELEPVIRSTFDLPLMARKAAGRHWKSLSKQDRARFVDTFSRLAVTNYAARFDGYSGERFETLAQEDAALETVLVRTRLLKSDGESVRLDYRLRSGERGWRIFDVFLDGTVSELALRRSEYSSVIRRDGFEALLRSLEEKIAAEAKQGAS